MIQYIVWIVTFLSLFVGIFWLQIALLKDNPKKKYVFPTVSIIIPCWNAGEGLWKTLNSISHLDYPKERLEIIVVNHDSTDNTEKLAKNFISTHKNLNIKLIQKTRAPDHMKAHAFNEGLKYVTGEFVACIDADTIVMDNSLKEMMHLFEPNVGSVISIIKVSQPQNIFEKLQHIEYIFSSYIRLLMSRINTLQTTHGALSVYRKSLFDKYGGFDEHNLTEDFEFGMRIRYHGYRIILATDSFTYTYVPNNFKWFWNQRIRWGRGFIQNTIKYRSMAFNKKYGSLGWFQLPLNILTLIIVLFMFCLMLYNVSDQARLWIQKFITLGLDYFKGWQIPNVYNTLLDINFIIYFPILVSLIASFFLYYYAYKRMQEPAQFPFAMFIYFAVYPFFRSAQWVHAAYKEIFKAGKKW